MSVVVSINPSVRMCGRTPPQRRGQRDEGEEGKEKGERGLPAYSLWHPGEKTISALLHFFPVMDLALNGL